MSADRFEITDTNGLRIDGIPWRERGLLVQYAAIRQQARDIAALKDALADEVTANEAFRKAGGARDDEDMPTFCARLVAERDEAVAHWNMSAKCVSNAIDEMSAACVERDQLRTDLAAAVAARANMETDLELARIECAGLERRVKSLDESLHALVEVSEDSTIALARAALNGDDDDEETGARSGNGGDG